MTETKENDYKSIDKDITSYQRCRIYNRLLDGENPVKVIGDYIDLNFDQQLFLDQMFNYTETDIRINKRNYPEGFDATDIINEFFKVKWRRA